MSKKLSGGDAFDSLMGKLVQVGKKDADRVHRAWKKKRAKKAGEKKPKSSG